MNRDRAYILRLSADTQAAVGGQYLSLEQIEPSTASVMGGFVPGKHMKGNLQKAHSIVHSQRVNLNEVLNRFRSAGYVKNRSFCVESAGILWDKKCAKNMP